MMGVQINALHGMHSKDKPLSMTLLFVSIHELITEKSSLEKLVVVLGGKQL
jgi:hypothetical protein